MAELFLRVPERIRPVGDRVSGSNLIDMDVFGSSAAFGTAFLCLGSIMLGVGIGVFLAVFFRDEWEVGPEEDISEDRFKELAREILEMKSMPHRRKYDRVREDYP